eukprot:scaffold483_cov107-Isochrysis_galbana.AAC.12
MSRSPHGHVHRRKDGTERLRSWLGTLKDAHASPTLEAAQIAPAKPLEQNRQLIGWQAGPATTGCKAMTWHSGSESLPGIPASSNAPCADDQQSLVSKACEIARGAGWQLDDLGEWTMLRFLVKHGWRLDRAAPHIRSTAAWRQSVDADGIRRAIAAGLQPSQFPGMSRVAPYLLMMFTNFPSHEGDRMTFVDSAGVFDVVAFIGCATEDEIYTLNLYVLEHMSFHNDRASADRGRLVRWSTHFDAEGVGMRHISVRVLWKFKACLPLCDNFYPELFGFMMTVNAMAPMVFFWRLVSPLLSNDLQQQVSILPPSRSTGALLSRAPASSVPSCYGGSLVALPEEERLRLPQRPAVEAGCVAKAYPNTLGRWIGRAVERAQKRGLTEAVDAAAAGGH